MEDKNKQEVLSKIAIKNLCNELKAQAAMDCCICMELSKLFNLKMKCEAMSDTACICRSIELARAVDDLLKKNNKK